MNTDKFERLRKLATYSGDLERDLSQHPDYYLQVAIESAQAKDAHERAVNELKFTEAEQQNAVRHATATGPKITVGEVDALVRLSGPYREATGAMEEARGELLMWEAVMRGFEAKGHIMRDLTMLACRGINPAGISSYETLRREHSATRVPLKK